jgi:hypothetical protein
MRRAYASYPPYTVNPTKNAYGTGGACGTDTGCVGPPAEYIDNSFCTTCNEYNLNTTANWYSYMFNGFRGTSPVYGYRDAEPNLCGSGTLTYDLWVHDGTPCGYCPHSIEWRCHDGIKSFSDGSPDQPVICHSVAYCDGAFIGVTC